MTQAPDRIKLPFHYDAGRMLDELSSDLAKPFLYYSVVMLTVPPDLSAHTGASRAPSKDNGDLSDIPYTKSIIDGFRAHTVVTLTRLLRLEAGAEVQEHTDPTLGLDVPDSVVRLTIPITPTDDVEFLLNGDPVPMQPGECWYMKLNDPHRVLHHGTQERVNLTLDVVPNAWVLDQLGVAA
ncbi:aspartyl/asparaginyl beta-hydroxylase domain-containing protein [uncultured Tateyamaria sp.]|uniref:aspartyl/asparaginyl beta-hydroxylase domain-containing protein n=1 Tax=uncultured Tateyamaria sp. TaxID=455651 RepID=UPI002632D37E|nr:aspartyl/asparaginyl beta-hydroxylase domain-containing protein [uncultured Tateyamaria sp.]